MMTSLIDGVPSSASSAICFSGTTCPRRQPPSAVMSSVHCASLMRSRSDSELKPPKTTECTAPMRAHASIAIASFGNQREIDRDAVAALHAERLHDVGELTDLAIQVEVGQRPPIARLTFPDDRRLVAPRSSDVTIDAIDARVERAADEPFRMRRLPLEHLRPLREPLQLVGEACPERLGIALGARVDALHRARLACD